MSFASQRRSSYLFGFILLLLIVVGIPAYLYFYTPPTCTDGLQNGMEEGIDCGGDCPIICSFKAVDPTIHWSRVFQVVPGLYTVVAFVENPNIAYETDNLLYTFKLRDTSGVLVYEQKGNLYLPSRYNLPVFATGIRTGERIPARVDFEFLQPPVWTEAETEWKSGIEIVERRLMNEDTVPRLVATIRNTTLYDITDMPLVATLYDSDENAVHASRTVVDILPASGEMEIVFTWPEPFARPVAQIDIVAVPTEPR